MLQICVVTVADILILANRSVSSNTHHGVVEELAANLQLVQRATGFVIESAMQLNHWA